VATQTKTRPNDTFDTVGFIMAWESGELDDDAEKDGFQHLIDSGLCWKLQGAYGRRAAELIRSGECVDTHHQLG
jgi:hypothetical protein